MSYLRNFRVIIVDQNADTRDLFTTILKTEGATVVAVPSASEALKVMKKLKPDILITDIVLPDMDGYTLISKIRNDPRQACQQIPAIAVTGLDKFIDQHQALAAGFQSYIRKPVDIEELVLAVVNLLTRKANLACT